MWRSFFLAVGISMCILGGECLVVEKAVVALPAEKAGKTGFYANRTRFLPPRRREVVPPEWAPWSLLSVGAVLSLYSLTVARQGG